MKYRADDDRSVQDAADAGGAASSPPTLSSSETARRWKLRHGGAVKNNRDTSAGSDSLADRERPVELPLWLRHDLLVVLGALALLAAGAFAYRTLVTPGSVTFERYGLAFERPAGALPPNAVPPPPLRLGSDLIGRDEPPNAAIPDAVELPQQLMWSWPRNPSLRLEAAIAERPAFGNLRGALSFERRYRYGELYGATASDQVSIAGHDWLVTRFRYAYKPSKDDTPRLASAIEYATVNGHYLYTVTAHGGRPSEAEALAARVEPHLAVDTVFPGAASSSPLLPVGKRRGAPLSIPEPILRAMPSAVMVVAVDLVNDRLRPISGGSGTIVGEDGSVLTNFHVIHDGDRDRLHDLFLIARFRGTDREPVYVCAGRPARSKLVALLDLALIKCDVDMNGYAWRPENWPAVPLDRVEPVVPGERIWVVGYPDVGYGHLSATSGEVEGLTGETGGAGDAFIKTNAAITHGNSGGMALDEEGRFVGVPTAFRIRAAASKFELKPIGQVGLVRPTDAARALLAIADEDWVPMEGKTDVPQGPVAQTTEAAASGVSISSRVVDVANGRPIAGAVVVVLDAGRTAGTLELEKLEKQAIAWAQTDAEGRFTFPSSLPRGSRYAVAVLAVGYTTLAQEDALILTEHTPHRWDPWGTIALERHSQ